MTIFPFYWYCGLLAWFFCGSLAFTLKLSNVPYFELLRSNILLVPYTIIYTIYFDKHVLNEAVRKAFKKPLMNSFWKSFEWSIFNTDCLVSISVLIFSNMAVQGSVNLKRTTFYFFYYYIYNKTRITTSEGIRHIIEQFVFVPFVL